MADRKRKIEIFSAGCAVCDDVVALVNQVACPSCEVTVLDMKDPAVARRAGSLRRAQRAGGRDRRQGRRLLLGARAEHRDAARRRPRSAELISSNGFLGASRPKTELARPGWVIISLGSVHDLAPADHPIDREVGSGSRAPGAGRGCGASLRHAGFPARCGVRGQCRQPSVRGRAAAGRCSVPRPLFAGRSSGGFTARFRCRSAGDVPYGAPGAVYGSSRQFRPDSQARA